MVSVIIPARNERLLEKTLKDVLKKARGVIEVICVLDGYWPEFKLPEDKRLRIIHKGSAEGMRQAINSAVAIARGEFLFKMDGHVLLDRGFDVKLAGVCEKDWMVIPRRKRLDGETFTIQEQPKGKPDVDYEFLSYPEDSGIGGKIWTERIYKDKGIILDDTPAAQGSAWFMPTKFYKELGLLDYKNWGPFWSENQEETFAVVLRGGGSVKTYKGTWYAHLHKNQENGGRGYKLPSDAQKMGQDMVMRFFNGEKVWADQKYPLSHLIELHMPMPTWDEKKLAQLKQREREHGW